MSKLKFIFRYLCHLFTARNSGGHGIHSPFIYDFVQNVIYEKHPYYIYNKIEQQREKLLNNQSKISVTDFGAGKSINRKISDIALKSLKRRKYAQLLFRIVHNFKAENIIELGTSFGISTSYLASASERANIITFEGCPEIAKVAQNNFNEIGIENIKIIIGNIDNTLASTLSDFDNIDIFFIDANHRAEPLLRYFELCLSKAHDNSVFIIDDIYWSGDMMNAWKQIKGYEKVTATIDTFEMGIVFLNPDLNKKHYKILF